MNVVYRAILVTKRARVIPAVAFAGALVGAVGSALAAASPPTRVDCDALIRDSSAAGETPRVRRDPKWGVVEISLGDRRCRESDETWRRRGLRLPVRELPGFAAPQLLSPPSLRIGGSDATVPKQLDVRARVRSMITLPPRPEPQACTHKIEELWTAGYHTVGGVDYLLQEVRAVDGNGDGVTENLQFTLRADDRTIRVLRFFARSAETSATRVRSLNVPSNFDVTRVCPGKVFYSIPIKTYGNLSIAPGLSGLVAARLAPRDSVTSPAPDHDQRVAGRSLLMWTSGFSLALLAGGILALYRVHRRRRPYAVNPSSIA